MSRDFQQSFEQAALPFLDDLYRTAVRLTQDSGKAGDAVQETFLIASKSFGRYQRGTNSKVWLFRILFDIVRPAWRPWSNSPAGKTEDPGETPREAAEPTHSNLTEGDILAALDRLPLQSREVVLLSDVQGFTKKEVSEVLQLPVETVMSRLSRGRALLRLELAGAARVHDLTAAGVHGRSMPQSPQTVN